MARNRHIVAPEDYYNTVDVSDYYDKVHRTTWARRVAGLMAGATLGASYGGAIGIAAAYLPWALTTLGIAGASTVGLPAIGLILSTMALTASAGAFLGIVLTTDVSANSASVAAGLEEMEKRHKAERLQDGAPLRNTVPIQHGDEPLSTSLPPHVKLFSWKVASITTPIFAAFGALIACNATTAAVTVGALGFAPLSAAAVVASATLFGLFGSLIGFKNSLISNKICNFYFKLITEQYFTKAPETGTVTQSHASSVLRETADDLQLETAAERRTSFAENIKRNSPADILAQREAGTAQSQDIVPTR